MTKKLLTALILIGLTVVVLLLNTRGKVSVDMAFASISAMKALVFLSFTALGVIIGILLK